MEEGPGGRRCATAFFCGRAGLFVLMTAYALLGALLFKTLEGGGSGAVPLHVQRSRDDCVRELWIITERLNVLYKKNWTKLATEQLKRFEKAVVENGRNAGGGGPTSPQWTFGGALLYSLTLLTTVGYAKLSPRTTLGKLAAMIYAIIGVPLMLILLSAIGSLLAGGVRHGYSKLCCKNKSSNKTNAGYQKAPTSPSAKYLCKSHDDSSSIQITTSNQNNVNCKSAHMHIENHVEHQEIPKRTLLATVRASHARGRCRQTQVRQMLADPHFCIAHMHTAAPQKNTIHNFPTSDVEDAEDGDDNENGRCSHDTPSRVPLIWRPPDADKQSTSAHHQALPPVPAILVLIVFMAYMCMGAVLFATTTGWSFLDAVYFCFIALSTIGIGDKLPQNGDFQTQVQLVACCIYLFLGLAIVAMCFSLVQDEIAHRCKQVANSLGLLRH